MMKKGNGEHNRIDQYHITQYHTTQASIGYVYIQRNV